MRTYVPKAYRSIFPPHVGKATGSEIWYVGRGVFGVHPPTRTQQPGVIKVENKIVLEVPSEHSRKSQESSR